MFFFILDDLPWTFCINDKRWKFVNKNEILTQRLSNRYGPARRIAEKHFTIVICKYFSAGNTVPNKEEYRI